MSCLARYHNKSLGLLFIRIALGVVFIYHGWSKFGDIEGTIGFFSSIGLSSFWVYLTAGVELVGGLLMIAGIFVREVGVLFAVVMLVAIFKVHFANGFNFMNGGYEFQFVLLLTSLAMTFAGAGKYALFGHKSCSNCKDGTCQTCKDGTCKCS